MRNITIFALAIFLSSCQKPVAKLSTNDQKSEKIKTLFSKVSEENIDYLQETFSDSMEFVNPIGDKLDKAAFIVGIQELYDMFDGISFLEMNGDAVGAEVETVTYDNGIVWTNVWNTFSATGKYTGQKVEFPFHLSYQWDGDKIIKEVQFFDMSVFEKEANAKAAINNTTEKVVINIEMSVNEGYTKTEVEAFIEILSHFIRTHELNTYDYSYFISEDGKRVTLNEKFRTSEDLILHADKFENGPNIDLFMKIFTFESFIVAGNTTEALRERIKAYPIEYRENLGGWIY